jgi:hypothetical protein
VVLIGVPRLSKRIAGQSQQLPHGAGRATNQIGELLIDDKTAVVEEMYQHERNI